MVRIADEEDTLDGVEVGAGEARERVDGRSGALRVALQNEAFVGAGAEGAGDFVDDVLRALGGLLGDRRGIDGVVDFAAGELRCDAGVHGAEAGRLALGFTCAAGIDDGVGRAGAGGCSFR